MSSESARLLWPLAGGSPTSDVRMPSSKFRIAIIGDVRIEARTKLGNVIFPEITQNVLAFAPAHLAISGTAVNMAKEATTIFAQTALIAKIGSDVFTATIHNYMTQLGIDAHLIAAPNTDNGVVVIVRDSSHVIPGGARLLVSGDPAPSHQLSCADIDTVAPILKDADLLFSDGYSIIRPESSLALRHAIAIAKVAGTRICVDLVPHNLSDYICFEYLQPYIAAADYVITEARTIADLLSLPHSYPFSTADVQDILPAIDSNFPGNHYWLLRHGAADIEEVLMYRRGIEYLHYRTGFVAAPPERRDGYGDRIAVLELAALLTRND